MKSNIKTGCVTLLVCVTGATTHAFASTSLHVKNVATTRCLDVVDSQTGVDGGRVQAWTCLDAANQRWAFVGATIRNSSHGKCLDEIKTNPGHVQIWACTGAANQNWTRYNDGTIRNAWSGRCLDEDNNAGGDGNRIQTFNCISNQMNQKWNLAE